MKTNVLLVFIFFSWTCVCGQNLLRNGDFELYDTCPDDFVRIGKQFTCNYWTSPNQGTPDYFNVCSKLAGVPINFAGVRNAYSEKGYVGIVASVKGIDYKEYVQGVLIEPLEKDKTYTVTAHICWSKESSFRITELGIAFSDSLLHLSNDRSLTQAALSFRVQNDWDWETLTTTYTAKGNERYLLLGNFQPIASIEFKANNTDRWFIESKHPLINTTYYFIDALEVIEVEEPVAVVFPVGEHFTAEGIYFDTDTYALKDSSFQYLDALVDFLIRHPEKKLHIDGHTDFYGTTTYNQRLSEKRALAVMDYLVSQGISKERIKAQGWGMTKPVDTREGFQYLNRRIELIFE